MARATFFAYQPPLEHFSKAVTMGASKTTSKQPCAALFCLPCSQLQETSNRRRGSMAVLHPNWKGGHQGDARPADFSTVFEHFQPPVSQKPGFAELVMFFFLVHM
eukprot:s624_g13.t1